jgi:hypothetical protein
MLRTPALRSLAAIALVAAALVWTGTGAARSTDVQSISFPGSIFTVDPCTGHDVVAEGTTTLWIETKPHHRVVVRERFEGTSHDGHHVVYTGKGTFSQPATSYDIKMKGKWVGPTTFASRGVDRVFADTSGTQPTGDSIQSLENKCLHHH